MTEPLTRKQDVDALLKATPNRRDLAGRVLELLDRLAEAEQERERLEQNAHWPEWVARAQRAEARLVSSTRLSVEDTEKLREALGWLVGDESLLAGLTDPSVVSTVGSDVAFRAVRARDIGLAALALLDGRKEKGE